MFLCFRLRSLRSSGVADDVKSYWLTHIFNTCSTSIPPENIGWKWINIKTRRKAGLHAGIEVLEKIISEIEISQYDVANHRRFGIRVLYFFSFKCLCMEDLNNFRILVNKNGERSMIGIEMSEIWCIIVTSVSFEVSLLYAHPAFHHTVIYPRDHPFST